MNKRYRLIKPFLSDKIYETKSLTKATKKCYNEIKLANITGITNFSIMDIDSKQIFAGKIKDQYVLRGGEGGPDEQGIDTKDAVPSEPIQKTSRHSLDSPIPILESAVKQLDADITSRDERINIIELRLNNMDTRLIHVEDHIKTHNIVQRTDTCNIM
jgi:hypothetical protein